MIRADPRAPCGGEDSTLDLVTPTRHVAGMKATMRKCVEFKQKNSNTALSPII